MKVFELQDLLANSNPQADVEVIYQGSDWQFNGKYSEEVDKCWWGPVEGVTPIREGSCVRIYSQESDVKEVY
jgi:hypothetical protein